jgi:hypothetical protein
MVLESVIGERGSVQPMQPLEESPLPPPFPPMTGTPKTREVVQIGTSRGVTESEAEEYELFKEFRRIRTEEARRRSKMKQVEQDLDRMSLQSYDSSEEEDNDRRKTFSGEKRPSGKKKAEGKKKKAYGGGDSGYSTSRRTRRRHRSSKTSSKLKSPFTDDISEAPVPAGLKGPKVKSYDGTEDPDDHVESFRWAIKMIPMDPKLWCLYFAGTLEGSARYWLTSLP